ncbi:hypothetical protein Gotur_007143 [Gossypium turneri]
MHGKTRQLGIRTNQHQWTLTAHQMIANGKKGKARQINKE